MPEKQKRIINTVRNLYSSFDLYAGAPAITINGEDQSKSILGASITVLIIIATFGLSSSTISDSYNLTNPKVTLDQAQGTQNITNINASNFFMSFSFFTPKSNNKKFGNSTNDYVLTKTMSTIAFDCLHKCTKDINYMVKCSNTSEFIFKSSISLKGLPINISKNITDIFKEFSYCLPDHFKMNLLDNDPTDSNFISLFTVNTPDTYNQTQTDTTARYLGNIINNY